jgi:hypothetical protein
MGKIISTCVHIVKSSLEIFSSKTSIPISINVAANNPCKKGIQACTNKSPGPVQRGDNCKIGWGHLIFFLKNH